MVIVHILLGIRISGIGCAIRIVSDDVTYDDDKIEEYCEEQEPYR